MGDARYIAQPQMARKTDLLMGWLCKHKEIISLPERGQLSLF